MTFPRLDVSWELSDRKDSMKRRVEMIGIAVAMEVLANAVDRGSVMSGKAAGPGRPGARDGPRREFVISLLRKKIF